MASFAIRIASRPIQGTKSLFAGTLTIQAKEMAMDGEFFDYSFPPGGGQPDLSGRGKPGA